MPLNNTHINEVDNVWNNGINVWLECGIDSHENGCMLLGKCVPVLTLDVLQIAEYCFAHLGGLKVCCNYASPILPNWDISWLYRPTLIYCELDGAYMPLASAQVDRISAPEYIRSTPPPLV